MEPLLPKLYDPDTLSINGKMLYRGVAHARLGEADIAPKHEQEWTVMVLDSTYVPQP